MEIEFSDEFGGWWDGLSASEQKSVDFSVSLLQQAGPTLSMPHSSGIETSRHTVIGADKTGNNRWYEEYVPLADVIYDRHLQELEGC